MRPTPMKPTSIAFLLPMFVRRRGATLTRSEEHTSELQSLRHLVCRLLLEKKKTRRPKVARHETQQADAKRRRITTHDDGHKNRTQRKKITPIPRLEAATPTASERREAPRH